jgi:serine/threonine protein kinase
LSSSDGSGPPAAEAPSLLPGQITRLLQELFVAPDTDLPPASQVGDRLGRFLLVREIGRGGFGLVFEAEDTHLRRRVAIKVLRPERGGTPRTLEWIQREGEAAAKVHHPTVVTLHDVGQWEGGTYLVYELLHGETLADRLEREPLTRSESRRVLRSVAVGLAQMHAAGVVHRDLKPDNVFIESDGNVKILDLGLAQVAGAVGIVAGSPPYVAPEQWRGDATDSRADVYAWGVLACRLLGNKAPETPSKVASRAGTFRALVDAARSPLPDQRPADGSALVAAMDRLDRRRRRGAFLAIAASGAVFGTLLYGLGRMLSPPPAPPSGPFRVAVADAENGSGRPTLDGIGDLVARELQASPHFQVLDRARLEGVLRASGRIAPERLDRGIAGFAARQAGGAVLLVPVVGVDGDRLSIAIDALEPENGRRLFSVAERAPSEDEVVPAVERLVARARVQLRDREPEVRGADREVTRAVSSSLQAHQLYLAGVRCMDHPSGAGGSSFENCDSHFLQALVIDPEFPLAHFELARIRWWANYPPDELRQSLEMPLRRLDRLSARERSMVLAWEASLSATPGKAVEILQDAARDFPEDTRILYALAEALFRQGRRADAVPHLERAIQLDPGFELANDALVWSLGILDRREDLLRAADRLARTAPSTGTLISEAKARGFTGDAEGAVDVLRRAAPGGTGLARDDLVDALVATGRWAEAEEMLQADAQHDPARAASRLVRYLLLRGRVRDAKAFLARLPPPPDKRLRFYSDARHLNQFLAPRRDLAGMQEIMDRTVTWSPANALSLAPALAYAGDAARARELAEKHFAGAGTRRLVEALDTWRRQGATAALPALREVARGYPLSAEEGPPEAPSWYAAECAFEASPDETALEALHRFQRFYYPLGQWRTWAYPRSLLLEARVLDRLGRQDEARAAIARLGDLLSRADPDFPLLAEARTLRRKLGPGPSVASTAPDPGSRLPARR